jgi:putative flippase GtrA
MAGILNNIKCLINEVISFFYQPFAKYVPAITFRYGFSGAINTGFDIFLYFIFYNFILKKELVDFGFIAISPHIAAFVFVFPITFSTGFLLARYIIFTQSNLRGRKQLFRYGLTVIGSIIIHYILLKFFVEYLGFWPTIAKIITVALVTIYSYFAQKHFSFKVIRKMIKD